MIPSLFNKSRPINYIIIAGLLFFGFVLFQISNSSEPLTVYLFLEKVSVLTLLIFSLFVSNFIAKRNGLSKDSSYPFLFYFIALLFFPSVFNSINLVIASFFVLLALRRLFSLQSMQLTKEKIFDASLWIFLASLFHFWAILFIILVFVSIIFHVSGDYRNWILPFIAFFTIAVITLFFSLLFEKPWFEEILNTANYNFKLQFSSIIAQNSALLIYGFFVVLFLFSMLFTFSRRPIILHAAYKKVIYAMLIGILIYLISPVKANENLIFTFFPMAILATGFVEMTKDDFWKQIIMGIFILIGITLFVFQL
ncbi:hypothetical protein [Flavobacterium orientale]|nr:hypothetical protein [Flavobacterium orientale]